jgi:hypothetical protein
LEPRDSKLACLLRAEGGEKEPRESLREIRLLLSWAKAEKDSEEVKKVEKLREAKATTLRRVRPACARARETRIQRETLGILIGFD